MKPRFQKPPILAAVLAALAAAAVPTLVPVTATATSTPAPDADAILKQADDVQRRLIELKSAVQARPDDAQAREQLGRLYLELGYPHAAEKELTRARELGRDDYMLRILIGEAWVATGKFQDVFADEALSGAETAEQKAALAVLQAKARRLDGKPAMARMSLEEALAQIPDYQPALLGLVEVALDENDLAAAELALERVTATDSSDAQRLLGDLAFKRGRYAEAAAAYTTAARLQPGNSRVLVSLAQAQMSEGKHDEAKKSIERVLALNPGDGQATMLLAMSAFEVRDYARAAEIAGGLINGGAGQPSLPLYIAGAAFYRLGNYNIAREYLGKYVGARPDDADGRRLLGELLLRTGAGAEAYPVLLPLSDQAGQDVALLTALGTAAVLAGKSDAGIAYLEQAAAQQPDDAELAERLAAARLSGGDRARGLAEFQKLAQANPGDADLSLTVAREHLKQGDLAAAAAAAGAVVQRRPDSTEALTIQAIVALRQGNLDAATAGFNRVLAMRPDDADARTGLAEVELKRGNASSALADFKARAAGQPDDVAGQINLAAAELAAARDTDAINRLETVLRDHPRAQDARLMLAEVYLRDKRNEDAQHLLADLTTVADTAAPRVAVLRARTALAMGRPDEAVQILKTAVAEHPEAMEPAVLLAGALLRAGDRKGADRQLDAVAARWPLETGVAIASARDELLGAGADRTKAAAAQTAAVLPDLILARIEVRVQRPQAAVTRLQGLLRDQPQSAAVRAELAQALIATQQWQEAQQVLDGAATPVAAAIALARARQQLALMQPAAAVATLRRLLAAEPGNVEARVALARALNAAGEVGPAVAEIEAAAQRAPQDPRVRYQRARLAVSDLAAKPERLRVAVEDIAALQKNPAYGAQAAQVTGFWLLREGKNDRGLALLREAHASLGTSDSLAAYADSLWTLGVKKTAMDTVDAWLAAHPQDPAALVQRGDYWLSESEYAKAAADLKQARMLGAQVQWLDGVLAYAAAKAGDLATAAPLAEAAGSAKPTDPMALHALGLVKLGQGDGAQAAALLKRAIDNAGAQPSAALRLDYAESLVASGDTAQARTIATDVLATLPAESPLKARAQTLSGH